MTNEAQSAMVGPNDPSERQEDHSATTSSIENVNDDTHSSGEKIITIRLERMEKEVKETYSIGDIHDILRAIVNSSDEVSLLSTDELDEIKTFDTVFDAESSEKYLKVVVIPLCAGDRLTVVFKLKTASTVTFRELKYSQQTMDALTKWKWSMNQHCLKFSHFNTRMIFNLFLIHPYWVNKGILASKIDQIIKTHVNEEANDFARGSWGPAFCSFLKSTNHPVVEIGLRKWNAKYFDELRNVCESSTEVLTMRVDRRIVRQMTEIVKRIPWDKHMGVKMVEENPKLNGSESRIKLVHAHIALWNEAAYVHLSWMPERMWNIRLPENENKTVEELMLEAVVKVDGGSEKRLFRSIHPIQESNGLYYLITTTQLLPKAEKFAIQLMAKVNATSEFKEDRSLQNPEKHSILVGRKADWGRKLHRQRDATTKSKNDTCRKFSSGGKNRVGKRCTTQPSQDTTTGIGDRTENTVVSAEDVSRDSTSGTTENAILTVDVIPRDATSIQSDTTENAVSGVSPADVLRRLQQLEEIFEELRVVKDQMLRLMHEQGVDMTSVMMQRDGTVNADEETVRVHNPRSKQ